MSLVAVGEKGEDPSELLLKTERFEKTACEKELFSMSATYAYTHVATNDVEKKYHVLTSDVLVTCSEKFLSGLNCSEPVKPMTEYSAAKLVCRDAQGNDPFEDYRSAIGKNSTIVATFTPANVTVIAEGMSKVMDRKGEQGCSVPPTPTPTEAPHNNLAMWIVTGLAVVAAIISFIVCCCQKKGKESESANLA